MYIVSYLKSCRNKKYQNLNKVHKYFSFFISCFQLTTSDIMWIKKWVLKTFTHTYHIIHFGFILGFIPNTCTGTDTASVTHLTGLLRSFVSLHPS